MECKFATRSTSQSEEHISKKVVVNDVQCGCTYNECHTYSLRIIQVV